MTTPPAGAPLRLVIADDQASVRQGLVLLLDAVPDIEVVGAAADGEQALDVVAEHHPDAILLDLRMPVLDGMRRSSRIASGWCSATTSRACSPSAAAPTTSMSGTASSSRTRPWRTLA